MGTVTNNGGGGFCVGDKDAPGQLLLALAPGDNEVDASAWEKAKEIPAVRVAIKSGRLVEGGNPGAKPDMAHIMRLEKNMVLSPEEAPAQETAHEQLIKKAQQEKEDFAKYPTMALKEAEALAFIEDCDDEAVLEACYEACESGKDTRPIVKEALMERAANLREAADTGDQA